ncbi:MAG: tRNA (N6-isopentenyl adenosine(37)-C2)-methylthiotransferase MiaB [Oscillospiraceae bacterium]|nr:tRNA (N6-isopentenyl adenosine(37)-C2)-methylthiotransferase MiaB [Oscillospiraceae bacterium]
MSEQLLIPLEEERKYIAQLRQIMQVRKRGEVPLAFVHTYGCQQNVADSEKIKGMLARMGFSFTQQPADADFILFNTCAVREHAEDRVFGNVGALKNIKRRHPSVIIALCGCMMEQEHVAKRIHDSYPFVNMLFGTHQICRFPKLLFTCITDSRRVFVRGGEEQDHTIAEGLPTYRDGKVKAWLTIMYGCNNFCSYCIVPYVRGRERSRTPQAVLAEFQQLVAQGYKDITLLGQNVNSYGKNSSCGVNFAKLLQMLDAVPGDYRIRFMTSHPKDCTHELLDTMAAGRHIAHHLHLPFQSGNDRVLKEMNRHYDRAQYLELVRYARKVMPDISLTSDVIVGFPGETYEEFCDTLSLIQEVDFTSLFTFIYSPREGTRAAKMPDPVPVEEKSRWFTELCQTQEHIAAKRCAAAVGTVQRVLVEERNPKNGLLTGRTGGNIVVDFPGERTLCGTFQRVRITKARNWILTGELLP